jgi:3-ketosteroid 9alpha-monooxygenase subunit A
VLLDAYCPHMGTHLGSGETSATVRSETRMEGDNIRCPFHAWRFGPDGVCNHIPYHDGPIPQQARVKSWPVEERYGIVFAWNDPEGLEPDYPVPEFPEWDDPDVVRWQGLEYLCDLNHPIEILDNMSDVAHLDHLHGGKVLRYENAYEGHVLHQRQSSATVGDAGMIGPALTTLAGYVGPGVAFGRFTELQAAEIICVTPIDDGTCRLWQTAMVKPPEAVPEDQRQAYRDALSAQFGHGLMSDAEVWRTKRPALHVMQLPSDGPFRQTRIWYSQFYNPREKAAGIVARVAGTHTAKGMPAFTQADAAE